MYAILNICHEYTIFMLYINYIYVLNVYTIYSTRNITATLLKKRLWHRRFPVSFAKFVRTPF